MRQRRSLRPLLAATVILTAPALTVRAQQFREADRSALPLECGEVMGFYVTDLDGDSILDVVFANGTSQNMWRTPMLSAHGDGSGRWHVANRMPLAMALGVADFDGDGDVDVLTNRGVAANDGLGALTLQGPPLLASLSPGSTVVADLTGDGLPDVVQGAPLVLLVNQGGLSFVDESAARLPVQGDFAIAAFDVEGDGDVDLFLAGTGGNELLRNQAGVFTQSPTAAVPPGVGNDRVVGVADLDGDLRPDLVVAGSGQPPSVYRNQGGASFVDVSATAALPTMDVRSLAIGDVDGDGDADLVFGEAVGARLLLAQPNGSFTPAGANAFDARGLTTDALELADMDGDGDLDLLQGARDSGANLSPFGSPLGLEGLEPRLLWNDGTGTFHDAMRDDLPARSDRAFVAIGDLDGDGFPDVVLGESPGNVLRNRGDATFDRLPANFPSPGKPLLADLDGDSAQDCVLLAEDGRFWHYRNVGGTLQLAQGPFQIILPAGVFVTDGALGDVNGDGRIDLVAATFGSSSGPNAADGTEALWLGTVGGGFVDASTRFTHTTQKNPVAHGANDADGDLDVVSAHFAHVNTGTSFVTTTIPSGNQQSLDQVALADLDHDGDLDLVIGRQCAGLACWPSNDQPANRVCHNDGTGTFVSLALPLTDYKQTWAVATGDVDGDGDIDLVFGNAGPTGDHNHVVLQTGSGAWDGASGLMTGEHDDTRQVLLADLDRDGDLDLFAVNAARDLSGTARTKVYHNMTRQLLAPYPARLGRGYRLEAHGSPAGAGIWMSGQGANTPLPPFGTLGLGPGAAPLALLPPPTTGAVAALDVVLPATPALAGLDVFVQAIDVATLRLSNTLHEQMVAW